MASTPNGGKLDALQDTNTGATQPHSSKTDYKTVLDKVADKSRVGIQDGEEGTGQSQGLVTKLVDQGKHLLGIDSKEDIDHNDKLAATASESSSSSSGDITDTHVQEFIRDAHRSQKITPKADGI